MPGQSLQNQALLKAISEDRALGSSILFDHRHTEKSPPMHVEMLDLWRCADEFVLLEAFRESAKTTLAEEFLLMEGCFGNFRYAVLFCETYEKSCDRIAAMAHEARNNPKLRSMFGTVLSKKPIENKIWFASGAMVQGLGWEQEITGMKYLDARPDRAYLDDIENLERVRSREAVDATIRKIYRELIPAMDKNRRKIRVTQTPRAADCMVTRLRSNAEWLVGSYPICVGSIDGPDAVSNWPERYSLDWIRKERDTYERAGMLREFMQEYMLEVSDGVTKPFQEEMLRYSDLAPASWMTKYAIYDPARTASASTSDRTGKVLVSRMGSKIIVHESGGHFWKPDEIREDIFRTVDKHGAIVGVEKNSLDEFLLQPIRFEMIRRATTFTLKPLQAPQDRNKAQFIMGLQPFFAGGEIILVGGKGHHPQLVAEILNFPGGRLDILNALAYSLRMFAGTPVYEDFSDRNVAEAPDRPLDLYAAWSASQTEVVCVAVVREGRHTSICADWAATGPTQDAVKIIAAQLRQAFPNARIQSYVPAEIHDQWQRVALVPALKALKFAPFRGEHVAVARGSLLDGIRTEIRQRRLLSVDPRAKITLSALAGEYKYPVAAGKQALEPEAGLPRMAAEALECLTASLEKVINSGIEDANYAYNVNGTRYISSLPNRSR